VTFVSRCNTFRLQLGSSSHRTCNLPRLTRRTCCRLLTSTPGPAWCAAVVERDPGIPRDGTPRPVCSLRTDAAFVASARHRRVIARPRAMHANVAQVLSVPEWPSSSCPLRPCTPTVSLDCGVAAGPPIFFQLLFFSHCPSQVSRSAAWALIGLACADRCAPFVPLDRPWLQWWRAPLPAHCTAFARRPLRLGMLLLCRQWTGWGFRLSPSVITARCLAQPPSWPIILRAPPRFIGLFGSRRQGLPASVCRPSRGAGTGCFRCYAPSSALGLPADWAPSFHLGQEPAPTPPLLRGAASWFSASVCAAIHSSRRSRHACCGLCWSYRRPDFPPHGVSRSLFARRLVPV